MCDLLIFATIKFLSIGQFDLSNFTPACYHAANRAGHLEIPCRHEALLSLLFYCYRLATWRETSWSGMGSKTICAQCDCLRSIKNQTETLFETDTTFSKGTLTQHYYPDLVLVLGLKSYITWECMAVWCMYWRLQAQSSCFSYLHKSLTRFN